jgi:hypothetical protein
VVESASGGDRGQSAELFCVNFVAIEISGLSVLPEL